MSQYIIDIKTPALKQAKNLKSQYSLSNHGLRNLHNVYWNLPAESLYAKMDLPLVLLEAMALGVPLVVSDRPPLSEVVHGGGVTVPPQDPAMLARAIADLLGHPARLREMGAAARAAALAHYDIRGVSAQHEQLYEDLLRR